MVAANLGIYLTLQAEGCSLELWNTHKGFLKQDFPRLVEEIKAQRRAEQEVPVWHGRRARAHARAHTHTHMQALLSAVAAQSMHSANATQATK